ncbi:hypothetical protein CCP1ISM_1200002 [Azospirillaceae bacterium]
MDALNLGLANINRGSQRFDHLHESGRDYVDKCCGDSDRKYKLTGCNYNNGANIWGHCNCCFTVKSDFKSDYSSTSLYR